MQDALFELIQERRWDKITVQDLLDRTGISRSTFYAHYGNKLDVLTAGVPSVAETLVVHDDQGRIDLHPFFAHLEEMSAILSPLLTQPVLGDIVAEFEVHLTAAFADLIDDAGSPLPRFLAGGLIATMRSYSADSDRPPSAEVAAVVESYLDAVLPTPTRRPSRGRGAVRGGGA